MCVKEKPSLTYMELRWYYEWLEIWCYALLKSMERVISYIMDTPILR